MAEIRGLADLQAKLNELGEIGKRKILQKALKNGAEVVRQEAENSAPRLTGKLAKEEMISIEEDSSLYEAVVKIGPSRLAFYGLFIELGTAHQVAQPFLEPALERKKGQAVIDVTDVLAAEIDKAVH